MSRYGEHACIVGIVWKDQNLPTAFPQPRLRRAVMHREQHDFPSAVVSERYQAASGSLPSCAVAIPAAKTMQMPSSASYSPIVRLAGWSDYRTSHTSSRCNQPF